MAKVPGLGFGNRVRGSLVSIGSCLAIGTLLIKIVRKESIAIEKQASLLSSPNQPIMVTPNSEDNPSPEIIAPPDAQNTTQNTSPLLGSTTLGTENDLKEAMSDDTSLIQSTALPLSTKESATAEEVPIKSMETTTLTMPHEFTNFHARNRVNYFKMEVEDVVKAVCHPPRYSSSEEELSSSEEEEIEDYSVLARKIESFLRDNPPRGWDVNGPLNPLMTKEMMHEVLTDTFAHMKKTGQCITMSEYAKMKE